jgi:hypothetical protein
MIGAVDQFTAQATLWGIERKSMPKAALFLVSGSTRGRRGSGFAPRIVRTTEERWPGSVPMLVFVVMVVMLVVVMFVVMVSVSVPRMMYGFPISRRESPVWTCFDPLIGHPAMTGTLHDPSTIDPDMPMPVPGPVSRRPCAPWMRRRWDDNMNRWRRRSYPDVNVDVRLGPGGRSDRDGCEHDAKR